jgi:hypothetical protein
MYTYFTNARWPWLCTGDPVIATFKKKKKKRSENFAADDCDDSLLANEFA